MRYLNVQDREITFNQREDVERTTRHMSNISTIEGLRLYTYVPTEVSDRERLNRQSVRR